MLKDFSWETSAKQYIAMYEGALAKAAKVEPPKPRKPRKTAGTARKKKAQG